MGFFLQKKFFGSSFVLGIDLGGSKPQWKKLIIIDKLIILFSSQVLNLSRLIKLMDAVIF